jgi:oligopeptide transport system substrate-binding protein
MLLINNNINEIAMSSLSLPFLFHPSSLHPHHTLCPESLKVICECTESLVRLTPKGRPLPGLAKKWQKLSDTTYQFTLQDNLVWSTGEIITASDFIHSWQDILEPKNKTLVAPLFYIIDGAEAIHKGLSGKHTLGVKALDNHTLIINTTHPIPYILTLLGHPAFAPIHPCSTTKNPISCGPFIPEEIDKKLSLRANTYYWNAPKIRLKRIQFVPTTISESKDLFDKGTIHVLDGHNTTPQINHTTHITPHSMTQFLCLTQLFHPYPLLRHALATIIDRNAMTKDNPLIKPAFSLVHPHIKGHIMPTVYARSKAIDKAKELIANTKIMPIDLHYSPEYAHMAGFLAQSWQDDLGLTVHTHKHPETTYLTGIKNGEFSAYLHKWQALYDDPYTFLSMSPFVMPHYKPPEGIDKANTLTGLDRYIALHNYEINLLKDFYIIPLSHQTQQHKVHTSVKECTPSHFYGFNGRLMGRT